MVNSFDQGILYKKIKDNAIGGKGRRGGAPEWTERPRPTTESPLPSLRPSPSHTH